MNSIIKIALGVVLGGLILFGIRAAYISYVAFELQKSVAAASNKLAEDSAARMAEIRNAEKVKQQRKVEAEKEEQRKKEEKVRQVRLAATAAKEKETAWGRFFQVSEDCLIFKTTQEMVDCSNIRIRARREFEAKYEKSN